MIFRLLILLVSTNTLLTSLSHANPFSSLFGYDHYEECVHEETKDCGGSPTCSRTARSYCAKEFPLPPKRQEYCDLDKRATARKSQTVGQLMTGEMDCVYRCVDGPHLWEIKTKRKEDFAGAACPKQKQFLVQPPRK